jgi:hypothetical protein
MTTTEIFLWGLGGSLAVEAVELSKIYYRRKFSLPYRYTLWHFYLSRLILSLVGGGLAVAYGIDKPLLAANIGAATPLLIEALSRGLSDGNTPPNTDA